MATIRKRGNSYLIRVYLGYDADGKQVEKSKTWKPPEDWSNSKAEKEAHKLAVLFEDQIRADGLMNGKIKFAEFANYWMNRYAVPNLKVKTVERYNGLLRRINKSIGHLSLEKIRPGNLLDFYASLANAEPDNTTYRCVANLKHKIQAANTTQDTFSKSAGISLSTLHNACNGKAISARAAKGSSAALSCSVATLFECRKKQLSPRTVQHHHRLISDILEDAVNWQYIPYNPCHRIDAPTAAQADIAYLDDMESQHLVELLRQQPEIYQRAICLLLFTGMRRGELLGLEWDDINWENKTLQIVRTSQYLPQRGVFTDSTKNKSSHRVIYIPNNTIDVLRAQYLWQQRQRKQLGNTWIDSNRVITSEDGSPMHPDRLTRWFGRFMKKTDLPPIHLHSLRHTYATLCIANGVPITAVSAQLGHASVATTASIYAHAIKSAQIAAADKMNNLFEYVLNTK